MYYDTIDMVNLLNLNEYDIDFNKTDIVVDGSSKNITINLYLNEQQRICNHCGCIKLRIKETLVKTINHPVILDKKTIIKFHQRKYFCPDCGRCSLEFNPLVSNSKNITILGELFILKNLREPRVTFSDLADKLSIPIQTVIRTFDEHVSVEPKKLTKVICIDENYQKKLTDKKFCCVIYDPIGNKLLNILDTRRQNDLLDVFARIPREEREKVQAVNMDMHIPYRDLAKACFPNAMICVDSFHVIKNLNKAMSDVRISVQKRYAKYKDDPDPQLKRLYWTLKTFHYFFTKDFDKIKYFRKPKSKFYYLWDKHQVLDELLKIDKNLADAYLLKEDYREFNLTCDSPEEARDKLDWFIEKFKKSHYEEFRDFGKTLARWHDEIINSFLRIDGKRMNNGPVESLNGRIDRLIINGYGYTNFDRFRNRAMYVLNKDEIIKNF